MSLPATVTGTAAPTLAELPLRPELVGELPYGAPQLDVPYLLNVNENPYPPSEQVVAEIAEAVAAAARGMNRYPERDARTWPAISGTGWTPARYGQPTGATR